MTPVRTAAAFCIALVGHLRWRLAVSAIVALAVAFTEGAGVLLIIPLLGSIGLTVTDGPTSGLAARIEAVFAAAGVTPTLAGVLCAFLFVSAAHALLYRAYLVLNPMLEQELNRALRRRLYGAIMRADWSFLTRKRMADVIHASTHEVDRASAAAYHLLTCLTGLIVSAMYVAIAFRLSPALTAAVAVVGLGVLWTLRGGTRRAAALGEAQRETTTRQFEIVSESLNGLKVTRSLGAEARSIELFERQARTRTDAYLDLLRWFGRSRMTLDISSALLVSVLLFAAVQWFELRGAGLLMLIFVFSRVMPRVMSLQASAQVVTSSIPSFTAVMTLTRECEAHAEALPADEPREPMRGDVRLENVSYSYSYGEGGPLVLDRVSLTIPAGRTTAIVGPSGAGKSTIADVLIGLLRPSMGAVTVDGRPLTERDLTGWRRRTGYVPQDGFLFHDTVRENLRWARVEATDTEMWRALERSAAADFVRARPEGLETVVGDRGLRLSGGERQRLSLARALLTNPDLLVLDEATSSLDPVNEQLILDAVDQLTGPVTTVIITHRLAAIRHADVIHVLEGGRLVESGSWPELAARNGPFARLLSAQPIDAAPESCTLTSASGVQPSALQVSPSPNTMTGTNRPVVASASGSPSSSIQACPPTVGPSRLTPITSRGAAPASPRSR